MSRILRLTEEQLAALTGNKNLVTKKEKVVIANGYRSNVQGDRTIGGKTYYFRSLWEINYAQYLEFLKRHGKIKDWEYEPRAFTFPKDAHKAPPYYYKPDFKIYNLDGSHEWHEVKGFMNPSSRKKIERLRLHYPEEKILVIDKKWFRSNGPKLSRLVIGWETLDQNRITGVIGTSK